MKSNYDKFPRISVSPDSDVCDTGWKAIIDRLRGELVGKGVVCIECYPGVFEDQISQVVYDRLPQAGIFRTRECLRSSPEIDRLLARELSTDPVFGRLSGLELIDFFDQNKLSEMARTISGVDAAVIIGLGAVLCISEPDLLIYADLARWEIQRRQRCGEVRNIGSDDARSTPAEKYKRAFFADWRAADKLKKQILPKVDFLLDTNDAGEPKMISGHVFRQALREVVRRPFRVQPFFDPGPWGGQWMRKVCDLPDGPPNYAWCFDCVPEENSLLLGFGDSTLEFPAIDLVFSHPRELLGEAVHARFGAEFPIRFDLLDTMEGGNLSLQVHPLTEYIIEHFGMQYTQDESYYMLDADEDACVYLGLQEDSDRAQMVADLRLAQAGGSPFPAEKYVNRLPARKHDHFLIPAGTIHCSGRNGVVLEISATPYIFTFKLWDWGRLGLDGRPRPIHLDRGLANIQWDRRNDWVKQELVNCFTLLGEGPGWKEERTGLHEREFIESRRHWFTGKVPHDTNGGVNVLNLVEGSEAVVESPGGVFEPFVVHYAETFIVPACVGPYTIRPLSPVSKPLATIKAFVRTNA